MITIGLVKIITISTIIIFAIIFVFIAIKSITEDWDKKYIDFKEGDEEKDFRIVYRRHPSYKKNYYFIEILKTNWSNKKYWEVEGWEGDFYHQKYFFTFKEAEEYLKKEYLDVSRKEDDKKIYYSKIENKSSDNDNDFWLKFARGSVLFENLKEEEKMEEETKKSDDSRKAKGKFCTFCGNELNVYPTHKGMILQCPVCLKEHQQDEKKSWDKEVNITTVILNIVMTILSYIFRNKKAENIVEIISKEKRNDK